MIDPLRYDEAERLAMAQMSHRRGVNAFRPSHFESQAFPTRIACLQDLRTLFSAMNGRQDAARVLREMRGVRDDDLEALCRASRRFIEFHWTITGAGPVRLPYTALLYYYLVFRKLRGMAAHAEVLDIGPGLGYLPFFLQDDDTFASYDQIEITQSLYILQSAVNSFTFRSGAFDAAAAFGMVETGGFTSWLARHLPDRDGLEIPAPSPPRCSLFPWWKLTDVFAREYDVVMSNENICEMGRDAFTLLFAEIRRCLRPHGVVLVHGIGQTLGDRQKVLQDRVDVLAALGYRALVCETSFENNGPLSRPNLILVQPGHDAYEDASPQFDIRRFDTDDAMVRSVFGLDEPDGEVADPEALRGALYAGVTGATAHG